LLNIFIGFPILLPELFTTFNLSIADFLQSCKPEIAVGDYSDIKRQFIGYKATVTVSQLWLSQLGSRMVVEKVVSDGVGEPLMLLDGLEWR
jgi:hypothetical protein